MQFESSCLGRRVNACAARRWFFVVVLGVLCATASSASASFPGRNGTIVYGWVGESAYRAGPTSTSIRAVGPRSGTVRVLRDCPLRTDVSVLYTDCMVMAPRYSPDGLRIAFSTVHIVPDFTGQPWQFRPAFSTMASDGAGLEDHATENTYAALAWAPAGDLFLLQRELALPGYAKPSAVFLASPDGIELSQVTPEWTQGPDWSSRGEIAFGRYTDPSCLPGCGDIWLTRVGDTPRRLTYRGGSSPSWSPHGTKLAFVRSAKRGRLDVYLVRRDGRGVLQLTKRGGYSPSWSPDGKWIAFIRSGDLYVIRTTGRDRRRLVDSPFDGEGPHVISVDWQALPRR